MKILIILIIIILCIHKYKVYRKGFKSMNLLELLEFNLKLLLINAAGLTDINKTGSILLKLLTDDTTLVKFNRRLREKYGPVVSTYIITKSNFYYILDASFAKQMLIDSPHLFGPGKMKEHFFRQFMPNNVGISRCSMKADRCPWNKMRQFNDAALGSVEMTPFYKCIGDIVKNSITTPLLNVYDFKQFSNRVAAESIYGSKDDTQNNENAELIKTFMSSIDDNLLKSRFYKRYLKHLHENYETAPHCSMLHYANVYRNDAQNIIDDQIPHWFAPFVFMFSYLVPNLLCVILNFKEIYTKIMNEMDNFDLLSKSTYLHYCVIEHIRLFNTININLQRTVEQDMNYYGYDFKKGDQLFIGFANILRDNSLFNNPDDFIPERWASKPSEEQKIVFSVGPQQCPSRNISPVYYKAIIYHLLKNYSYKVESPKLKNKTLYFINPYNIRFSAEN